MIVILMRVKPAGACHFSDISPIPEERGARSNKKCREEDQMGRGQESKFDAAGWSRRAYDRVESVACT